MMTILIAVGCLFLGLFAGVALVALCTVAHDADAWADGYAAGTREREHSEEVP